MLFIEPPLSLKETHYKPLFSVEQYLVNKNRYDNQYNEFLSRLRRYNSLYRPICSVSSDTLTFEQILSRCKDRVKVLLRGSSLNLYYLMERMNFQRFSTWKSKYEDEQVSHLLGVLSHMTEIYHYQKFWEGLRTPFKDRSRLHASLEAYFHLPGLTKTEDLKRNLKEQFLEIVSRASRRGYFYLTLEEDKLQIYYGDYPPYIRDHLLSDNRPTSKEVSCVPVSMEFYSIDYKNDLDRYIQSSVESLLR